jgi:hypothetical protein
MPYLGKSPQHGNYSKIDDFSGDFDGSDATHAIASNGIAITPVRPEALIISINGVIQEPVTDYTVSGTNITFTTAPASTDSFFGVVMGEQLAIGTPSDATITSAKLTGNLVTPGTLDINGQELILDADADTSITADTDDQIDIKIAGADDFQFTANMFKAQSSSQIQSADGSEASPGIVFTGDTSAGLWRAESASGAGYNSINITNDNDGTSGVLCLDNARLILNDGTDINAQSHGGLTISQAGYDNEIFSLKSSDIAHAMTGGGPPPAGEAVETDTYFFIRKSSATLGGASVSAFAEDGAINGRVLNLVGYGGTATTAKSTSGHGVVSVHAGEHNGSGARASFASNSNLFSVSANDGDGNQYVQFIVDLEGDIHYNGSDAGAYDEFEDAQLTRALDLSQKKGIIDSKFDKFIAYNHEKLADLELVGREENGEPNHFINLTGMQRLHNGAIWQQYEKHHNLLNAVYELAVKSVGEEEADNILEKHDVKLLN